MQANVERITIQGSAQLPASAGATPTNIAVLGPMPQDGAWTITGSITAVDTAAVPSGRSARSAVVFYPQFEGVSIAGVATRLDSYGSAVATPPMACQPQDRGLAGFGFVVPNPVDLVTVGTNSVQLQVTGPGAGVELTWAYDLVLSKTTLISP